MNFGIDYDRTFTACPELLAPFIRMAKAGGHGLFIVTARQQTEESTDDINEMLDLWDCQVPIIFTAMGSKLHAVARHGICIDIWIDDDPRKLVHGH